MPVAIVGATASGKSDLAIAAARAVAGTEIIAVDAMQVYRGMDIGTAKPTLADQAAVAHHGIDLVEPSAEFAVAEFQTVALAAMDDISNRGGQALLVAGTGLYLSAVVDRLTLPGQWPEVRAELDADPDLDALFRRLADLDPVAASRMEPSNRRRIVRALEVCIGSGRPFSSFGPGIEAFPPSDVTQVGLRWPRDALVARIEARVHQMMGLGLLDEVRGLWEAGPLSRTAHQALGYKELIEHLEGDCSLAEAVDTIVVRTRQFATRQIRWFRRDPRIRWIDIESDALEALATVVELLSA